MKEFMSVAKALADENRVRLLMALRSGELCVCQLIEMLGLAPSTVSKHLAILHQAGLLDSRKEGRWIYYRLADVPSPAVRETMRYLESCLGRDTRVTDDARSVKTIRRTDKKMLCCRYKA